jgi:hypothetical protein
MRLDKWILFLKCFLGIAAPKSYAVTIKDVLITPDPVVAGQDAVFLIPAFASEDWKRYAFSWIICMSWSVMSCRSHSLPACFDEIVKSKLEKLFPAGSVWYLNFQIGLFSLSWVGDFEGQSFCWFLFTRGVALCFCQYRFAACVGKEK